MAATMNTGFAYAPAGHDWETICRRIYGLTPKEQGTLLAIGVFNDAVQAPMPRWELERVAAKPEHADEIDLTTPGRLACLGLIELIGYRERRSYAITRLGRERLAR